MYTAPAHFAGGCPVPARTVYVPGAVGAVNTPVVGFTSRTSMEKYFAFFRAWCALSCWQIPLGLASSMTPKVDVLFLRLPFPEIASDGAKDCPRIVPLKLTLPFPHASETEKNATARASLMGARRIDLVTTKSDPGLSDDGLRGGR